MAYAVYKLDNSVKKLNTITIRKSFFHSRGLTMPKSRSPPFFVWKHKDKKEKNGGNINDKRILPLCRWAKIKVSEQIYKVYWQEREHEKYLEQVDKKNHLLFFSSLNHDGNFEDNLEDKNVDVEKVVATQMKI